MAGSCLRTRRTRTEGDRCRLSGRRYGTNQETPRVGGLVCDQFGIDVLGKSLLPNHMRSWACSANSFAGRMDDYHALV